MRRFYQTAAVTPAERGYGIAIDGKPIKTPGKRDLRVPTAALATAIATEWNAQADEIRSADLKLTQLANAAIDRVPAERAAIVQQIADYAGTDLVCYRATRPPELIARQQAVWQPLVDWALERYAAPLEVTAGIVPIAQSAASLRAFAAAVDHYDDFALAALHLATAACGSLIIALALVEGRLDPDQAFAVSQLDESFQIEKWGEDAEQGQRRQALADDIATGARFLTLLRS